MVMDLEIRFKYNHPLRVDPDTFQHWFPSWRLLHNWRYINAEMFVDQLWTKTYINGSIDKDTVRDALHALFARMKRTVDAVNGQTRVLVASDLEDQLQSDLNGLTFLEGLTQSRNRFVILACTASLSGSQLLAFALGKFIKNNVHDIMRKEKAHELRYEWMPAFKKLQNLLPYPEYEELQQKLSIAVRQSDHYPRDWAGNAQRQLVRNQKLLQGNEMANRALQLMNLRNVEPLGGQVWPYNNAYEGVGYADPDTVNHIQYRLNHLEKEFARTNGNGNSW